MEISPQGAHCLEEEQGIRIDTCRTVGLIVQELLMPLTPGSERKGRVGRVQKELFSVRPLSKSSEWGERETVIMVMER